MKKNNSSASIFLAIVLTIGAIIVSWKLIAPAYATNVKKLNVLDQEIMNASSKKESLDNTKSQLASIDATYNAMSVAVPDNTDEPNLITELEAIALKNGIVLPSISISSDVGSDSSDAITVGIPISISLNVEGSFDTLNNFIGSLEKSVKFMNIQSLNYASAGSGEKMALSIMIQAYSRPSTTSTTE